MRNACEPVFPRYELFSTACTHTQYMYEEGRKDMLRVYLKTYLRENREEEKKKRKEKSKGVAGYQVTSFIATL